MQTHCVVGQRDRLLGRAEQVIGLPAGFQDDIELRALDFGVARHVGEVAVDLGGNDDRLARAAFRLDIRHQIECDVSVGTETDASAVWLR